MGRECSITTQTDTLHTAKGSHFSHVIDGRSTNRKFKLPAGRLELITVAKQFQQLLNKPNPCLGQLPVLWWQSHVWIFRWIDAVVF